MLNMFIYTAFYIDFHRNTQNINLYPNTPNYFICMIYKINENVNDPLNPLFLTLDPPKYSGKWKTNSKPLLDFVRKHINPNKNNIGKWARQTILGIGGLVKSWKICNMESISLENMRWKFGIFQFDQSNPASHSATQPPNHPPFPSPLLTYT